MNAVLRSEDVHACHALPVLWCANGTLQPVISHQPPLCHYAPHRTLKTALVSAATAGRTEDGRAEYVRVVHDFLINRECAAANLN